MPNESTIKICSIPECVVKAYRKGFCSRHYSRWRIHGNPLQIACNTGEGETIEQRFWSKIKITANIDKCWEWQAAKQGGGYGSTQFNGRRALAHRVAFTLFYGHTPKLLVLHSCDNPPCCNPHHLRDGSAKENGEDKKLRKRYSKTHCKRGHEYNEQNTWFEKSKPGYKQCRACNAFRQRRRREKREAQAAFGNPIYSPGRAN
jgi:hypothetical protein